MAIVSAFMVPHPPLIVQEIGRGEERKISDTIAAYKETARRIEELRPDTIVLTSPHAVMYSDYFHISPGQTARGDFGRFRAGHVSMRAVYDTELVQTICEIAGEHDFPAGTQGERERELDHGTMVPLYFVNQRYRDYKLVRIGLSGLPLKDHYRLGQYIREAAEALNRRVVLIASGDLSHKLKEDGPYGYAAEGPEYDSRIMTVCGSGEFKRLFDFTENFCEKAGECGHRSFTILAGALDRERVSAQKLSYEGPFGVGYGICAFQPLGRDENRNFLEQYEEEETGRLKEHRRTEDAYVKLARAALEEFIRHHRILSVPAGLPDAMRKERAGTFVSLHKDGRLRGCIGTISATQPDIAEEIIHNAISAGTRDPRFSPVREEELEQLTISVDVLGETEEIPSMRQLDVKRFGVVVTKGRRRGLLLPNLEGVDTPDEQIAIAKQKAGIGEEEEVKLERFEVVRHE